MTVEFRYCIFQNKNNGYTVSKYRNVENGRTVTCVGFSLPSGKGRYNFDTELINTKYGPTEKVLHYEDHVGSEEEDVLAYLSSGAIKGVGRKTAKKIFDRFGASSLEILEKDPRRLLEIKGLSGKIVENAEKAFAEKRGFAEASRLLAMCRVSPGLALKICRHLGPEGYAKISANPYILTKYRGTDFHDVDTAALGLGFGEACPERINAAARHVLIRDMDLGNTCMELHEFADALIGVLDTDKVTRMEINEIVINLIKNRKVRYRRRSDGRTKREYIYTPEAYEAEEGIVKNISRLLSRRKKAPKGIEMMINKYAGGMQLDKTQRESIKIGTTEPLFIITGGPGTGKTTITRIIAQTHNEAAGKSSTVFLAPTGRAARRITESTGFEAQTIHSRIGIGVSDEGMLRCARPEHGRERITDSLVLVDESSMIDLWVMDDLLASLDNCSIGFIGDADQLPSVGCGSVLRDMIASKRIPYIQLDHIHRQADEAMNICLNAKAVREGRTDLTQGGDFFIFEESGMEETEEKMLSLYMQDIERYGIDNVKCLCPFKKNPSGAYSLNTKIQEEVNHSTSKGVPIMNGMAIKEGDLVMQLKNRSEASNGDIGKAISAGGGSVSVDFGTSTVTYPEEDARLELTLAYATTVHKSQGSEYKSVIMCVGKYHSLMLRRNLLYTGITRGIDKVAIVGSIEAVEAAIKNNSVERRNSMLRELIEEAVPPEVEKGNTERREEYA